VLTSLHVTKVYPKQESIRKFPWAKLHFGEVNKNPETPKIEISAYIKDLPCMGNQHNQLTWVAV
jgi:hypothetical protein